MQIRLGIVTCLLVSSVCFADASNYDYVQAAYLSGNNDVAPVADFTGFGVEGSFQFYREFYGTVRYADLSDDGDIAGVNASAEQLNIGVGFIFGANSTGSVYGEASYIDVSKSDGAASASDDGYGVGLGVRVNTGPRSEIHIGVSHEEIGSEISETAVGAELLFDFFPSETDGMEVSGLLGYSSASGGDVFYFGARVSF